MSFQGQKGKIQRDKIHGDSSRAVLVNGQVGEEVETIDSKEFSGGSVAFPPPSLQPACHQHLRGLACRAPTQGLEDKMGGF